MTKRPPQLPLADGTLAAASALGRTVMRPDVTQVLDDYRRLSTDEQRAQFADHFLGRTAGVMEEIWPTFYEMLKRIEEGQLYSKPGHLVGNHTYGSFREYFEYRVGRPFETWAQLEGTYHYAKKYAPNLLQKAFAIARNMKERATQGAQAVAQEIREGLEINKGAGPPSRETTGNHHIMMITGGKPTGYATSAEYLTLRIARERRDILDRMCEGQFPSVRAAALEAGIAPRAQTVRMDDAESAARTLRKHMPPSVLAGLIELLTKED